MQVTSVYPPALARRFAAAALLITALLLNPSAEAGRSPYDWAHIRLDYARREKAQQLRRFCDRMHGLARKAAEDKRVTAFFDLNLTAHRANGGADIPADLNKKIEHLRRDFDSYYIEHYFAFQDMLFVDAGGDVVYAIRRESDRRLNLLKENGNPLGRALARSTESEAFVDFHFYAPSGEPAAFFVEPVATENGNKGWVVLQCAINRVNSLFTSTRDLGQTGETFLVNENGFMLTESLFTGESTCLRKKLDDRNIRTKFSNGSGQLTVTDYRGATALTSFEVFPFMGTRWLLVAKLDKAEITTEHYTQHRRYYGDRLLAALHKSPVPPVRNLPPARNSRSVQRIDMDEFLKAETGERLETFGIATCTGFIAAIPERFAYLAHITPKDVLYGGNDTNLLGQMNRKIANFDIRPCEKRQVLFVVVAPHTEALLPIVDRLVARGFLLSQIHVLTNPDAKAASLAYDYKENDLHVSWRTNGTYPTNPATGHTLGDAQNVGKVVREIMQSEESMKDTGGKP